MAQLVAIHTIQYLRDGKQVSVKPSTLFEIEDDKAEYLIKNGAARRPETYSAPQVQAAIDTPAPVTPAEPVTAPEPAPTEPETAPEDLSDAEPKAKRTRKAKTEADAE